MNREKRQRLEELIEAISDPETKEHYRLQLAMADDLEGDGLLEDLLPLHPLPVAREAEHARTYVFQWFRKGETTACEQLVVHTAGTERSLALFEQNAASGALVHGHDVSPRCKVLRLDADDCHVCFGAGEVTVEGNKRSTCDECAGTGKGKG